MTSGDRRYMLEAGQGHGGERTFFRHPLRMLATGEETGDEYTFFEQLLEQGFAPPLHAHHIEDEAFYVLDGEVDVVCGDARWALGTGGFAFLPHSVPHSFRVRSATARLLQLTAPSGFEEFAAEMADVELSDANFARIAEAAHRAGYEMLGPPPFDGV
ncbi:cupin domain-containing protein [Yinghuangia seranimata]|uniref:cupin domain-containing protein n=1 Tax=Yinghuangia seranimata TaxID=408067 RepID=UPI00248CD00E|nr:cupin domain-containing protein [Yinghuangia seranimata]MDI2128816.1 cupin domain-containing protein [Yinghuangia seranimata]